MERKIVDWERKHSGAFSKTGSLRHVDDDRMQVAYQAFVAVVREALQEVLGMTEPSGGNSRRLASHRRQMDAHDRIVRNCEWRYTRFCHDAYERKRAEAEYHTALEKRAAYSNAYHQYTTRDLLRQLTEATSGPRDKSSQEKMQSVIKQLREVSSVSTSGEREVYEVYDKPSSQVTPTLHTTVKGILKVHETHNREASQAPPRDKWSEGMVRRERLTEELQKRGFADETHRPVPPTTSMTADEVTRVSIELNTEFTFADLKLALKQSSTDTAPGDDEVTFRVIKTCF